MSGILEFAMLMKAIYDMAAAGQQRGILMGELEKLEKKYNKLPDKRKRPGPELRKAIDQAKKAISQNNLSMLKSAVGLLE